MTCRVIWQVYTWHMTRLFFPTKLMFLACQMEICLLSVLPISAMNLSIHGISFLKSYMVLKIFMVYDRYILWLLLVYTKIMLSFNSLWLYHKRNHETATTNQIQHAQMHYEAGDSTWSPPNESKAFFTEHSYMTGICQVYACHIFQLDASESASAARLFRACRVSQARRDVSDLDFLRILSVLATESPPTRGWGLPKFHNQVI